MAVTPAHVLDALRRIKGPDLDGNIVDLGLVSDVLIKDRRAYFSITVDPARAAELEPLRKAAETVVAEIDGIVRLRFSNQRVTFVHPRLLTALNTLGKQDLRDTLVTLADESIRVRRTHSL